MDFMNKLKEYFMKRDTKKNIQDLLIIFIVGLMIVILYNFFTPSKTSPGYIEVLSSNEKPVSKAAADYEDKLKQELTDTLSLIEGAGKVKVMIYFESGNESVPAFSENQSNRVIEETDSDGGKRITNENNNSTNVITSNENGSSKPFVIKEIKPKISGIIVIAEGASNPEIKYRLYEAVKTVFNIAQYKINVYAMQK